MLQKYKMICFRQDYEAVDEENNFCYLNEVKNPFFKFFTGLPIIIYKERMLKSTNY